jgi:ADP-glucose pyrophosphorylase
VPIDRPTNSIGGVYDELMASRPGSIRGFVSSASYWDIGTVADYWAKHWELADSKAGAPGRSILWNDVRVGEGAVLDECIVTDGVRVPAGARYRRMILMKADANGLETEPFSIEP